MSAAATPLERLRKVCTLADTAAQHGMFVRSYIELGLRTTTPDGRNMLYEDAVTAFRCARELMRMEDEHFGRDDEWCEAARGEQRRKGGGGGQ